MLRFLTFLILLLCAVTSDAQPLLDRYKFNSAEYFTYSVKKGDFVPGLKVSTHINISLSKETVKMQTFASSKFKVLHMNKQHVNGSTEYGFLLEDVNHNQCLLKVLTTKSEGHNKISVSFLYNKGPDGYYQNMTEYKNRLLGINLQANI